MAMNAVETGVFLYLLKRTGMPGFAIFLLFCGLLCVLMVGIASTAGRSPNYVPLSKAVEMQREMVGKHAPEYAEPKSAKSPSRQ